MTDRLILKSFNVADVNIFDNCITALVFWAWKASLLGVPFCLLLRTVLLCSVRLFFNFFVFSFVQQPILMITVQLNTRILKMYFPLIILYLFVD